MNKFFAFLKGKLSISEAKFHYLRIGKTIALLDQLRELDPELGIEWIQHEADSFADYHFSSSYAEYDGAVVVLNIDDENIVDVRRDFWENFIFKTSSNPLPLALIIPRSDKFGSLTRAQVKEALSLIRLTDRPFELFEDGEGIAQQVFIWLEQICSLVHKKEREPAENA